jgi:hypothetical protein
MSNAFLRIRQKLIKERKYREYLIFGIGEIFLVMIGILLALQVNNLNEKRKEDEQIRIYAKSLAQELEDDIAMIKIIENSAKHITFRIDSLSNYIRDKQIEEMSNLIVICLTWNQTYRPYSWNRATLEEMKNSGSLRLIKNPELSKKIVQYDTFTRHMDEDYNTDKNESDNANQILSRVVNYNYPNIEQLAEMLRVSVGPSEVEFDVLYESGQLNESYQLNENFSNPIYKEAEDYNLSFVTKDIEDLNNAVNGLIRLKFNFSIRLKIELPRLIEDARDIIKLLEEEYDFVTTSSGENIIDQIREH